jgi:hypothetical protein
MGDLGWAAVLAAVTLLYAVPASREAVVALTTAQPYVLGFLKFMILATLGELLALRLTTGAWQRPTGLIWRMLVWGLVGVAVTFMFSFYSRGVAAGVEAGLLPVGTGFVAAFLAAFYTSALMNVTFGPVFMAAHRISDTWIDLAVRGKRPSFADVLIAIDWPGFMSFVVARTIPLWWIPAHTLTFLLPGEYRVLAAAYLSIVLGVILAFAKGRKTVSSTARRIPL